MRVLSQPTSSSAWSAAGAAWDQLRRPIWVFHPVSWRGLYANRAALGLWNAASLDELLARDFSKMSPAVLARLKRLAVVTAHGEPITEAWTFYPNGQPVTVRAVISSIEVEPGDAALLFEAVPIEVDEAERRAVEALRHTSSLISLFDTRGRSLFTNPAAFAAYGEADFLARFCDAGEGAAALDRVAAGEVLCELLDVTTAEGPRSHHLDARRVLDPVSGEASILLSERDVSAQVEAERALRGAEERAEVAEAKERFLANMSHELRTPLNSVTGFAALLASGDLDPAQAEQVQRIASAGGTLTRLVDNLITACELESDRVSLACAAFDPHALLQDVVDSFQGAGHGQGTDARPGGRRLADRPAVGRRTEVREAWWNATSTMR